MTTLNRIREVCDREGVLVRTISRHLNVTPNEARDMMKPSADLHLSDLRAIADALQVPASELVGDSDSDESIRQRGLLLQLVKGVNTLLLDRPLSKRAMRRIATWMRDQIVLCMPEANVDETLPLVGKRRTLDEVGRAGEDRIHV